MSEGSDAPGEAPGGGPQILVVNRWKRYGKDRLYVTRSDEVKVGWWDLISGEAHPETADDLSDLTLAVEKWRFGSAGRWVEGEVAEVPAPKASGPVPDDQTTMEAGQMSSRVSVQEPTAAERPWLDLATNLAGAAAREQALSAKDAAPVRTFLARALGVHTEERAWRVGADGEEKVAAQLAKVIKKDPRWRVIHAIPVGTRGSDIDHLVMGPGGVFTINAKHHPGAKIWIGGSTFLVNGHKQPYIRNARFEANRASQILTQACGLPVHVEGIVVPVGADDVVVKTQPDGVGVIPRMQVAKWLLRHGDVMGAGEIEAVHDIARRSTTWRPSR